MKLETKEWLEIAEKDYQFGLYGYGRGFYPQAIYMLCQALEKVLKASLIEFTNKAPKKIHRLEIIAKDTGLILTENQIKSLTRLSEHYTKVRYPDYVQKDYNTRRKSEPIVKNLTFFYKWVSNQFKSH